MITPLRRRHFYMWIIIAPLILAGATAAYLMAPKFPIDHYNEAGVNFPELLRSVVSKNYMFNLKKNYSGGTMLEIVQISKINPVSELVMIQYTKPGAKKILKQELGMMGGDKTYLFNLGSIAPPFSLTVIDTIKRNTLAKIEF
ncbi:MAG TPA: hypothetical protein VE978_14820 [Chitinophagales bacterium]|nr:hypothetical protein [Chitinophagales bacterium]